MSFTSHKAHLGEARRFYLLVEFQSFEFLISDFEFPDSAA